MADVKTKPQKGLGYNFGQMQQTDDGKYIKKSPNNTCESMEKINLHLI